MGLCYNTEMSQQHKHQNGMKKRGIFPSFGKKNKTTDKNKTDNNNKEQKSETESTTKSHGDLKMDEIDNLVATMTNILNALKKTINNKYTHHSMDVERFQKLIDWVDYNESHLSLLQQAWNDESFWPFLSTIEATEQVTKDKKHSMLIRLSNTKPGAITVTRCAKAMRKNNRLEDIVKHKRYFPSLQHGKLTLIGSWGEREVTWDGLLAHLKQKECCICLEELREDKHKNVLRLNCGHHFHRHCIERHVQHSKSMNNTQFAVCPLCRERIENAELINEPSLAVYKKIPDITKNKKAKSFEKELELNTNHSIQVKRANTDPKKQEKNDHLNSFQMGRIAANHPWNQFENHLDVNSKNGDWDDDYQNAQKVI